jgi:hypothetical protein
VTVSPSRHILADAPRRRGRPAADDREAASPTGRWLQAVEGDLFGASAELVHQRADLEAAASPENNSLLERVLRIEGLPPLARELILAALAIERDEDAAILRARERRARAHAYGRRAAGRVEQAAVAVRARP